MAPFQAAPVLPSHKEKNCYCNVNFDLQVRDLSVTSSLLRRPRRLRLLIIISRRRTTRAWCSRSVVTARRVGNIDDNVDISIPYLSTARRHYTPRKQQVLDSFIVAFASVHCNPTFGCVLRDTSLSCSVATLHRPSRPPAVPDYSDSKQNA